MSNPEELRVLAPWKVHTLTGDRKGTWSVDTAEREICDVNLEDYAQEPQPCL
jgi:hypothetical protein